MNLLGYPIKRLDPKEDPKYSKYIYGFLKRHGHVHVYKAHVKDGFRVYFALYRPKGRLLTGTQLEAVVGGFYGYTGTACFGLSDVQRFEDITAQFWKDYREKGMCLVDGHRDMYSSSNPNPKRYRTNGENEEDLTAVCKFCGKEFKYEQEKIIITYKWKPIK